MLIERIDSLPAATKPCEPEKGRVILAHGEVTGHAHEVEHPGLATLHEMNEAVRLLGDLDDWTGKENALAVERQTAVIHDEHGRIPLERSVNRVRRQREYSPEAIRNVAD